MDVHRKRSGCASLATCCRRAKVFGKNAQFHFDYLAVFDGGRKEGGGVWLCIYYVLVSFSMEMNINICVTCSGSIKV